MASFRKKSVLYRLTHFLVILTLLMLTSCQTITPPNIDHQLYSHDELFPDYGNLKIETEDEIFAINDEIKSFIDKKLSRIKTPNRRIEVLSEAIFDRSDLNLLYQNDANTTASQTFNNRSANCLSLIIMTSAMADYADIDIRFQKVHTPELWVRRNGTSLLNRHVNLLLFRKIRVNDDIFNVTLMNVPKKFQLDFDSRARSLQLPVTAISKHHVLGMFYNNKGAEALIKDDYNQAYAYFRAAITSEPLLMEGWSNLGLLYRKVGKLGLSENVYKLALTIDDEDSTVWENLAGVYRATDRRDEANIIKERLKKMRTLNPYYHFMLGEIQYEKKNWQKALKHYHQSIRLYNKQHMFYFALAKTYYQLGDIEKSESYMIRAKRYTKTKYLKSKYQSKLDQLLEL